ncbi:group 3 secretory phospholipase A2-like [Watersipora subatra]|uniref:group 3 secretory phospholipase A2-like n=1 Tax=Watersipora subatra TaxID=2589382 RepID=UPI00355C4A5F
MVRSEMQTGLRWDVKESDGKLVRSITDGKEIITLEYNSREELVQCWSEKETRHEDAIPFMYYSAMTDKKAVRKDAIEVDLKKIKRACKSYMKNVEEAANVTALQEEIENIKTLREGVDGSKWCGLREGKSGKKALKREDRCCKKWHNCEVQIKGYHYNYMMYNYRPHKLIACNCTLELESCLRNITMSSLTEEVLQVMFGEEENSYHSVCLTIERRKELCAKWDNFYHKCEIYEWAHFAEVKTLKEYRDGLRNGSSPFTTVTLANISLSDDKQGSVDVPTASDKSGKGDTESLKSDDTASSEEEISKQEL